MRRLYVNQNSSYLINSWINTERLVNDQIDTKVGDTPAYEIAFGYPFTGAVEIDATDPITDFRFGAKESGRNAADYIVSNINDAGTAFVYTKTGTGAESVYTVRPDLNRLELRRLFILGTIDPTPVANPTARYARTGLVNGQIIEQTTPFSHWIVTNASATSTAAGWDFAPEKPYVDLDGEIEVSQGEEITSTATFLYRVANDINRGNEGNVRSANLIYPTPAQIALKSKTPQLLLPTTTWAEIASDAHLIYNGAGEGGYYAIIDGTRTNITISNLGAGFVGLSDPDENFSVDISAGETVVFDILPPSGFGPLGYAELARSTLASKAQLDAAVPRVFPPTLPTSPLLPLTGNIYGFGDSQMYGFNTTASGSRLAVGNRFLNIIATSSGRSLTVNNYGLPGGKTSYYQANNQNIWNLTGNLPFNWTGVVAFMGGWNNIDNTTNSQEFYNIFERNYLAFAAKFLVDGYGGLGNAGTDNTGANGSNSWASTGTNVFYSVTAGDAANSNPFYFGDPNGFKNLVSLASTQKVSFTLTNKRKAAFFFETAPTGGTYQIKVNGLVVLEGQTSYTPSSQEGASNTYAIAEMIDIPRNAAIEVFSTSGTVKFLAYGFVNAWSDSLQKSRVVLFAAMTGNTNLGSKSRSILEECNRRAVAVVRRFPDLPIYFVNALNAWRTDRDQEPTDTAHITIAGNNVLASAFAAATKTPLLIPTLSSERIGTRSLADLMSRVKVLSMSAADWTAFTANGGVVVDSQCLRIQAGTTANALAHARSNGPGSASLTLSRSSSNTPDWSIPIRMDVTFCINLSTSTAIFYIQAGKPYNNTAANDLANRAIGLKIEYLSLKAQYHNGTFLVTTSALVTLATGKNYLASLITDGIGGFTLELNGVVIFTTATGAPSTVGSSNQNSIECTAQNGTDAAFAQLIVQDIKTIAPYTEN